MAWDKYLVNAGGKLQTITLPPHPNAWAQNMYQREGLIPFSALQPPAPKPKPQTPAPQAPAFNFYQPSYQPIDPNLLSNTRSSLVQQALNANNGMMNANSGMANNLMPSWSGNGLLNNSSNYMGMMPNYSGYQMNSPYYKGSMPGFNMNQMPSPY